MVPETLHYEVWLKQVTVHGGVGLESIPQQELFMHHVNPSDIVDAIRGSLQSFVKEGEIDPTRWRIRSYRTHKMLGKAIRNAERATQESVISKALERLGFARYRRGVAEKELIWAPEWRQIDALGVECAGNWDRDCWNGHYRLILGVEVENDFNEFELTMRGLLDLRLQLGVGIFYLSPNEGGAKGDWSEVSVAGGPPGSETQLLADWTPPWEREHFQVVVEENVNLVAIFLDWNKPDWIGHRIWTATGNGGTKQSN